MSRTFSSGHGKLVPILSLRAQELLCGRTSLVWTTVGFPRTHATLWSVCPYRIYLLSLCSIPHYRDIVPRLVLPSQRPSVPINLGKRAAVPASLTTPTCRAMVSGLQHLSVASPMLRYFRRTLRPVPYPPCRHNHTQPLQVKQHIVPGTGGLMLPILFLV